MEKILAEQDIHIDHNRIHRLLKEEGLAKNEPHKQREIMVLKNKEKVNSGNHR